MGNPSLIPKVLYSLWEKVLKKWGHLLRKSKVLLNKT